MKQLKNTTELRDKWPSSCTLDKCETDQSNWAGKGCGNQLRAEPGAT